jgi:signal transduction histidine kinase
VTHRSWTAPILLGAVLAAAAAAATALHVSSRARALHDFEDRQQHAIGEVASVIEAGLAGSARALRLVAAASREPDGAPFAAMLEQETRCGSAPCAASLAIYRPDGSVERAGARPVALDAQQVRDAVAWARDPANAERVRSVIARSVTPSLVLQVPRPGGGFAAEEVPFDVLFERTRSDAVDAPFALLVVSASGHVMFRTGHPEMRLNSVFQREARCATCHASLAHVDRMVAMQRGIVEYNGRTGPQVAAVAPIMFEREKWTAAAIAPASSASSLTTSELRQLGLLALGTLVSLGLIVRAAWREQRHDALTSLNAKLEQAAVEWRMTVDTIDAAVLVLDPSGTIERMNRVAADLLPGAPFSWLGRPSEALAAQPPWDAALALAREAIQRDAVTMARVAEPRGATTWDLWCRAPRRADRRHSVVIVARDVTALVELQASVRRSETMAALGLVVAGVAHEVRNPLFAISSLVDAWALRPAQPPPPQLIGALRKEVLRLKTLMNELLEYGSPPTAEMAWHDLGGVIDEAIAACHIEAESRGVRLVADVPRDLRVWMDPRRLVRVFINLLQNATQHAPEGTAVTLALRPPPAADDEFEIEVRDRGRGFAPEDLPRVFTPFFSRRAGGFGLGLAICARIIAEHGGRLGVANHPDGGAMLIVALPLVAPADVIGVAEGVETC